jgi:hypothetical protein
LGGGDLAVRVARLSFFCRVKFKLRHYLAGLPLARASSRGLFSRKSRGGRCQIRPHAIERHLAQHP